MKRIVFYLCLAALLYAFDPAAAQCPPRTTIADTIYNADGSLASGRVVIAWPTFAIGACQVVAGRASVSVANGAFSVELYPNITAVPAGTSYRVTYYLKSGKVTTEYWVVPASGSPVNIASVRSASVPVPNVMFSQSQVTNLLADLARKVELPSPCAAGKFLQSNGSASQPQVNCVDGTGGGGGGSQHQVNGTNLSSNDPVNFQSTATIAISNPSSGNVQAAVLDSSITAAKLNVSSPSGAQLGGVGDTNIATGALSPNRIAGTAEVQSNKAAANGYASLNASSKVVQDPANAQVTAAASKIPLADGAGKIADGWLSANVSLLGPTIDLGSEVSGVLPEVRGGTNQSTYSAGDVLYASAANTLGKLPIGAANRVLFSDGSVPSWSTVPDAALASNYSGVGACTNQFARALNRNAAPTCATVQKADAAATFAHTDQANTYTAGAQDFGAAASLKLPTSATAEAHVNFDTAQKNFGGWSSSTGERKPFPRVLLADNITTTSTGNELNAGTIGTTETAFGSKYSIPANFFTAQKALRVVAAWEAVSPGSAVTFRVRLRIGGVSGTLCFDSGSVSVGNNQNVRAGVSYIIQGTAAPGAAVSVECSSLGGNSGAGSLFLAGNAQTQPVSVATNSARDLVLTIQFGGSNSGNILRLRQLIVEELN